MQVNQCHPCRLCGTDDGIRAFYAQPEHVTPVSTATARQEIPYRKGHLAPFKIGEVSLEDGDWV
jgi:hypothetical protein